MVRTTCYALGMLLTGTTAFVLPVDVTVVAADGARLTATYSSPGTPGPGVVLFHQCDMDRRAWTSLETALRERGIHVLSPEYRGMGDNRDLPADYSKRLSDAEAALTFLAAQPDVDAAHLAVGGASCGVDLAVQVARQSGRVRALVLLSGGASDEGMAFVGRAGLPVFFAFSADEGGPLPRMKTALATTQNPATTIREFRNAGHGVPMFASEPRLLPELADWVRAVLGPGGRADIRVVPPGVERNALAR